MNRKARRQIQKHADKEATDEMALKVAQFGNLPQMCTACKEPFDKKNKEMVQTWNVVIKDPDTVRLYCPACWTMATDVAAEYFKSKETKETADEHNKT